MGFDCTEKIGASWTLADDVLSSSPRRSLPEDCGRFLDCDCGARRPFLHVLLLESEGFWAFGTSPVPSLSACCPWPHRSGLDPETGSSWDAGWATC